MVETATWHELALQDGRALSIKTRKARLELTGSDDDPSFALTDASGADVAVDGNLIVSDNDGRLRLEEDTDRDGEPLVLAVRLPASRQATVKAHTANGALLARDLSGDIDIGTTNGPITLSGLTGTIGAHSANGSVDAERITGDLSISVSNGKITVRESALSGGALRSANGRINLQTTLPTAEELENLDSEGLVLQTANGRIVVALPEASGFTAQVRSMRRVRNRIPVADVSRDPTSTTVVAGDGAFHLSISSLHGSVDLVPHDDFVAALEGSTGTEEDEEFGWFDFTEEIPRFMHDMKKFGVKFGKLGEEVQRQMRHSFKGFGDEFKDAARMFRGEQGHEHEGQRFTGAGATGSGREETSDEVRMVLDMLKDGKVSVEEAEKLIAAIRGR